MAFNWKLPSPSVLTSRVAPVDSEVSLTEAPATALPLVSVTVPVIEPVTIWAADGVERMPMARQQTNRPALRLRIVIATVAQIVSGRLTPTLPRRRRG